MYRQAQLTQLLSHRHILIAGYGREGKSTHALLQKIVPEEHVDIACNDAEIFDLLQKANDSQSPYDLIIKSPGISTMKFEGRCSLDTITSQTDLFLQVFHDITVGITGTKGKSTTTTLVHHILSHTRKEQQSVILAGNIGIPLFDIIEQIDENSTVVVEFSCHQLENIHRAPHVGVILNLYQEHLDHYHNYRGYQMAKMQLMLRQQSTDHCFYCTDSNDLSSLVDEVASQCATHIHPYSVADAKQHHLHHAPLQGDHNLSNIYVARQVTALLGVTEEQFDGALASFHGLPHRLELVGTYHGITFYNDSISTIPEACIAAIQALVNVDTIILGGFDRGIDYAPLGAYLAETNGIRNIVFVGQAGKRMLSEWETRYPKALEDTLTLVESDYAAIIPWCFEHTLPGKICLLSPAASSYDAFKNFEERGTIYKNLITNYCQNR